MSRPQNVPLEACGRCHRRYIHVFLQSLIKTAKLLMKRNSRDSKCKFIQVLFIRMWGKKLCIKASVVLSLP